MSQVLFFSLAAAFNPTLLTATTVMLLLPTPKRLLLGGRLPTLDCYAPRASVTAAIAAVSASLMGLSSPSDLAPATRFASEMTKRR
jgi:hypothetical protein